MVRRWGILWSAIEYSIPIASKIIIACATLHNYCVDLNEDIPNQSVDMPEVDVNGILVGNHWKINYANKARNNMRDNSAISENYIEGGNSVQRSILKRIQQENIVVNK
jgi:hypothetical protein